MSNTVTTVITIDGPSGSGKGTLAARLAVHYGFNLLDSGALYRLLAYAAAQQLGQSAFDTPEIIAELVHVAETMTIEFIPDGQQRLQIQLNGQDVTESIRTEQIGLLASKIAAIAEVRQALLLRQQKFAQSKGLIADGRDMGTVVFPNAAVKIYLTASAQARATRRFKQLQGMGVDANIDGILSDLLARDKRDMERVVAPLRPATDAYLLDSSELDIEQVFQMLVNYIDQRLVAQAQY